ncbi:hypothetical protein [Streptomyces shenzhenensis]|uniref:hypothetical protein n=1 Tax=Streptomyces shenzhenensis TaxID=943815 RepID=UPI0015F0F9A8|nr:hypothetical protein [Streptomyces shenzhenensis]
MLTGKIKHSVRNAKIRYADDDPQHCAVRAWTGYRTRLVAEHGQQQADPSTPAFAGIDGWVHVLVPVFGPPRRIDLPLSVSGEHR